MHYNVLSDEAVQLCILRSDYKFSSYYNQLCTLQVGHFLVSGTRDNGVLISIYLGQSQRHVTSRTKVVIQRQYLSMERS